MEVRAHTPFPPQCFKSRDAAGTSYDCFAVKATFDIVDDRRLKIAQEQEPVTLADEHFGDPARTSLRRESDLKPFKPNTDIVVMGDAIAPGGDAAESWFVEVGVDDVRKALRVHGPRSWRRRAGLIWQLTKPAPCTRVPIRYEHAFGGCHTGRGGELEAYRANPIGVGFIAGRISDSVSELPAAQVEDPNDPVLTFGQPVAAAGFGWIGRSWSPRLERAGTYDEAWKASQWPLPPRDFDEGFNNGAHPDLVHPGFLRGGETFSAMNMTASGSARFEVPRWEVAVRLRYRDGRIVRQPTQIDTLLVDFDTSRVMLTYRARVPESGKLRVVEICMVEGSGGHG